jgi:hypothetical protein
MRDRNPSGKNAKTSPVIVELFTSEGCSSCPPADSFLETLTKTQPIPGATVIALAQHVDYWNQLGWKDPYSSEQFSARQLDYSSRFGDEGVYTPQMVVDGRLAFVGSRKDKANEAISNALASPKADIQLSLKSESPSLSNGAPIRLSVHLKGVPPPSQGDRIEMLLAITEDNLHSNITRGENSGRNLHHIAVVRRLSLVAELDNSPAQEFDVTPLIELAKDWNRENLRAVVFLQEHSSRLILGAAQISLAP